MSERRAPLFDPSYKTPQQLAQEKADYMYGKVHDLFSSKVMEAEMLRQKMDDPALYSILHKFASENTQLNLEAVMAKKEAEGVDITGGRTTVDLAMAGFFRIGHVHENSMAVRTDNAVRKNTNLRLARVWHSRHSEPIPLSRTTENTHQTIHGGSIFWLGETGQDLMNTERISGNDLRVNDTLRKLTAEISRKESGLVDLGWMDDEAKRKAIAGLRSAEGLLYAQAAKAIESWSYMGIALAQVKSAHELDPNAHRLATVSLWALAAALRYNGAWEKDAEFFSRPKLAFAAVKSFSSVLFSADRKAALSALKQAVKRKV